MVESRDANWWGGIKVGGWMSGFKDVRTWCVGYVLGSCFSFRKFNWVGFCCCKKGAFGRCNWPGVPELLVRTCTADWPLIRFACQFFEKSSTKKFVVSRAVTCVGREGGFMCARSGWGSTFCTALWTWFTGFSLSPLDWLFARSALFSLPDCCSWAWMYSRYNASCWGIGFATPGSVMR